ncbi:MAG: DUF4331 family protein [Candidatus Cloacimonetes bacterium]|nr:DUF4331 family protein [Candidatus Cloacimonadota bacterium]
MNFKKYISTGLLSGMAFISTNQLDASDHIDFFGGSKNTTIPRALDLTDFYAWTPEEGKLVVAVNAHLAAIPGKTQFSEQALYKFRLRNVEMQDTPSKMVKFPKVIGTSEDEVTITCQIKNNDAICGLGNVAGEQTAEGLTVYSGVRGDSFILDAVWARKRFSESGKPEVIAPTPLAKPSNFSDFLNVLNLTVEIDIAKVLGSDRSLVGVFSEVVAGGTRVDRVGRPEVTNMIIRTDMKVAIGVDSDGQPIQESIKHIYNNADTFQLSPQAKGLFSKFIAAGITGWDKQDAKTDWTSTAQVDLTNLLVNDYLVVDTTKTCAYNVKTFLDIERSIEGTYTSCGGRTPSEDIIDTLTSFYVAGPNASKEAYGDGVTRTLNPPSKFAPYFSKPFVRPIQD